MFSMIIFVFVIAYSSFLFLLSLSMQYVYKNTFLHITKNVISYYQIVILLLLFMFQMLKKSGPNFKDYPGNACIHT